MKIAVVGSINMDVAVTTPKLPMRGETLIGNDLHYVPGGKGANQAVALAKLGADVTMFGCVGDDQFGGALIKNLQDQGVNTSFVRVQPAISSGVAIITVGENDNTIIVVPGANKLTDEAYVQSILPTLSGYDIVLFQLEIPLAAVRLAAEHCSKAGKTVILNPAPAQKLDPQLIQAASFITPNEHEVKLVFDQQDDYTEILKQNPGKLIVTLGSAGAATALASGEILHIPPVPATVVDTTGAGDTFNGAFAYGLSTGLAIDKALLFANAAAAVAIESFGAQTGMPTLQQVEAKLQLVNAK